MRMRMLVVAMAVATTVMFVPLQSANGAAGARCPAYGPIRALGTLHAAGIREISGAVASARNHVLWMEQDSGNPARVYAVDTLGIMRASVQVTHAKNHDWEDIAYADGTIWLGDIGGKSNVHQLYWFKEPRLGTLSVAARMATIRYPDGEAHNSEAMFVDETNGRLIILTKERNGGKSFVFGMNVRGLANGDRVTLRRIGVIPFPRPTAADVDSQGFILRGLKGKALYYPWARHHSIRSALRAGPCHLRVGNGEAVAFSRWSHQVFTTTEGGSPKIRSVIFAA